MAQTDPSMENDQLHTYIETLNGNGSKSVAKTNNTANTIVKENTSKITLDDSTIIELIKLCCKFMSKTADNTDSLKTIVSLLSKLVEKKSNSKNDKSSTIKVETSGKGSSSNTNTILVNNTTNNSKESNDSAEQLIDLLTRLASE